MNVRVERGAAARLSGRRSEVWAAIWLMAKGYRILGFRLATPQCEIDLLALRGRTLAVVAVKRRRTIDEAISAVTSPQRDRLLRAARAITAHRRGLHGLQVRLDLFALAPGARPRHIRNAWGDGAGGLP